MEQKGIFTVSLDFELMWGVIDKHTPDTYGANVLDVHMILPRLIQMFDQYGVHTTIGTVGFIMYENKEPLLKYLPAKKPDYENMLLSPYRDHYMDSIGDKNLPLYFAPDLVRLINDSENVELASHTFCHYYCQAAGQQIDAFDADIKAAVQSAESKGYHLQSIIFPRNQVNESYLTVCRKYGFKAYRGNPKRFFNVRNHWLRIFARIGRLLDTYVNITGYNTTAITELSTDPSRLINIPASRFLRPYSRRMCILENLKVRRIKQEMAYAAKHGEIYHLWWHPHNFGGRYQTQNLHMLNRILEYYEYLQRQYGMISLSMSEIAVGAINLPNNV